MHVSKSRFLPKQDTEPLLGLEEEKMFYQQHEKRMDFMPLLTTTLSRVQQAQQQDVIGKIQP